MILLLTGCINPNGMTMTSLSNQEVRMAQYIEAIRFYLSNTKYPIVFTENSGTDISGIFSDAIDTCRMEFLTFSGNQNKERGKGYGECEIIQYALDHSKIIRSNHNQRIVKITGRLIVKNIKVISRLHTFIFPKQTVFCSINSDLSFPDSRFFIAPIAFLYSFLQVKEKINDFKGYYFEHALYDILKEKKEYSYSPFFIYPQIIGMSGSTGKLYTEESGTFSFVYRYARHSLSQMRKFNKLYRDKD
jgi:hypothetical protein